MPERPLHLVFPHQLFEEHLAAPAGTTFVLVEHDLLFRQYRFHRQKLVLHRASMRRFATRLREAGFEVEHLESDAGTTSRAAMADVVRRHAPSAIGVHDVVDDWLGRDVVAALGDAGHELTSADVLESPGFLTSRAELAGHLGGGRPRMQHFYAWQRRRLDVLVTEGGDPVGGRWSFDAENRKKLPKGHPVPARTETERHDEVDRAIAWVDREFPDNPGAAGSFGWPTSHDEAEAAYEEFLAERFHEFGPYEDALSVQHPYVFHATLTPGLNSGLISPHHVLRRALEVGESDDVPLASLEGFVRQVIGWREYMRAVYVHHGRGMRTRNELGHTQPLSDGWWTGETGLAPVDHVIGNVLENGYAHHIERLMVLGNAMSLLRIDPDAAYEWFMEMFVDAYDWVMVPNVYAMSQFAAGAAVTTKPYVSGSAYLRKMSDHPRGEWCDDWDALYWTFVRDHRDVFDRNARAHVITANYDRLADAKKDAHAKRAARWLA